jgi:hypothetical protein
VESLVRRKKPSWIVTKNNKYYEAVARKKVWLRNSPSSLPKLKGIRFLRIDKLPKGDYWDLTFQNNDGSLIARKALKSSDDVSKVASQWMNTSREEGYFTKLLFPKGYLEELRKIRKKTKMSGEI